MSVADCATSVNVMLNPVGALWYNTISTVISAVVFCCTDTLLGVKAYSKYPSSSANASVSMFILKSSVSPIFIKVIETVAFSPG